MCFDGRAVALRDRDMSDALRRWRANEHGARYRFRLAEAELPPAGGCIASPRSRVGVCEGRVGVIVGAPDKESRCLECEPGSELGAIPRPFPLRVVLRSERPEDVTLADVLVGEFDELDACHHGTSRSESQLERRGKGAEERV